VIERGQRRLRVVLPWLETAPSPPAPGGTTDTRAAAAEWMVARGRARQVSGPWREWLLAPTGAGPRLLRGCPAGPGVRALQTGARPVGTWACARPVHLVTAIEHLRLAPEDVRMGSDESAALLSDINRHLGDRGLRFHACASGRDWLLECAAPIDCSSVEPQQAAGRNVRELMPAGRDGSLVRSLLNEIQMLLHEHPVNLDRAASGRPAINTVWLWGFGQLREMDDMSLPTLYTDDAWLAGIWRLHDASCHSLDEFASASGSRSDGTLVMMAGCGVDSFADAEERCFAPALEALKSGSVSGVDLLLGGRAIAVETSARLRFWRRRRPLGESLA
jgi:hypothetical protein